MCGFQSIARAAWDRRGRPPYATMTKDEEKEIYDEIIREGIDEYWVKWLLYNVTRSRKASDDRAGRRRQEQAQSIPTYNENSQGEGSQTDPPHEHSEEKEGKHFWSVV